MKRGVFFASIMLCMGILFHSCGKDDNIASEIAGTYKGTNFSKTETSALVVISEVDDNHVSIQYDGAAKALAPVGADVKVTKSGDTYTLSGSTSIETTSGSVKDGTLTLKVTISGVEIVNITAKKQ